MARLTVLLGLTVVAVAACSTGNAIGPIPEPLPPQSVAPVATTLAPVVTSIDAPVTTAPAPEPSIEATTAAPAVPVVTEPSPEADFTATLTQAATDYWQARRACSVAPPSCDSAEFTVPGSELQARFAQGTASRVDSAAYARLQSVTSIEVLKVLRLGDDLAAVTVCEVNGDWLMDSNGTPDESDDIIRNDLVGTMVGEFIYKLTGGRWLPSDYTETSVSEGSAPCNAG